MIHKLLQVERRDSRRNSKPFFQGASICLLASTATVAVDGFARATLWTNQIRYITLVAQLSWIYGDVNRPCPQAAPLDSVTLLP